ncbi:MAG TPA: hypothetical protein VFS09_09420 [Candidatus Eisenbacteria bacterium]|nr:hypothetical protein [Candidatus Eisenbacteria bacterium]
MNLSFGDAVGSAIDSVRGFRWAEFAPFFWILAVQWIFLALTTQLDQAWAMSLVAPMARLVGGENNLHYPTFFSYLSIFLGWLESFLYVVPGAVLIPMSLLRFYRRSDRALSLGAGAAARLAGAFVPTLLAGVAGMGAIWSWQRYAAGPVASALRGSAPQPLGDVLAWLAATLGSYAILSLLLYVPVAAVQARTNPIRAIGMGLRFGFRSWPLTLMYTAQFGIPAMVVQYLLERQGAFVLGRLRPELIVVFLAVYVAATSVATYLAYMTAARFYKIARGES